MGNNCIKLSVIVPFRYDRSRKYLESRLRLFFQNAERKESVEYLLVDSGSDEFYEKIHRDICLSAGVKYLYHDSFGETFSIGAARDFGAQHAKGELITFLDVDLVIAPNFFSHIITFSKFTGVFEEKRRFFVVPCLYLTEYGSTIFLEESIETRHREYLYKYTMGDKLYVENLSPCSSVMVVNRTHYLSIGGHHPQFKGHGYEDFELIHRLVREEGRIPSSYNYYKDTSNWEGYTFNGFRAQFSLLGVPALRDGLCVAHLWHPRPENTDYTESMTLNRDNAIASFQKFDKDRLHPPPLISSEVSENRVLFFCPLGSAYSECIRDLTPHLGKIIYAREDNFINGDGKLSFSLVEKYLSNQKITHIFFSPLEENAACFVLYTWAKRNRLPFYCFGRGVFPDSWFIDNTGFQSDSMLCNEKYWNKVLSEEQSFSISKYIKTVLESSVVLDEKKIFSGKNFLKELKGTKILYVSLPRRNDLSVVQSFSCEDLEAFLEQIDLAAKKLFFHDWDVICKRNYFETVSLSACKFENIHWIEEDINSFELVELSDAITLMGSDIGILSMMMGKPCYIFGDIFYSHDKLNVKVADAADLANCLINDSFKVCHETMKQYIYYLRNEYYSYGISESYFDDDKKDDRQFLMSNRVSFYRINIPGCFSCSYKRPKIEKISIEAPLLERYAYHISTKNRKFEGKKKFGRYIRKFIRDPKTFFLDSRYGLLNYLGRKMDDFHS